MEEEYKSLLENNTWDLVKLPPNRTALKGKWVCKVKTRPKGEIVKYKA